MIELNKYSKSECNCTVQRLKKDDMSQSEFATFSLQQHTTIACVMDTILSRQLKCGHYIILISDTMVEDVDLDENDDMFADPNEEDEDFEPFVKFNPVSKLTITVYRTVGI